MKLNLFPPTPITPLEWIERLNDHNGEIKTAQESAVNHPSDSTATDLARMAPKTHKLLQKFYRLANVAGWEQQAFWDMDSYETVAFQCAATLQQRMYGLRDFWSAIRMKVNLDIKLADQSQWRSLEAWAEDIGEPFEDPEVSRKEPDGAGVNGNGWREVSWKDPDEADVTGNEWREVSWKDPDEADVNENELADGCDNLFL